MMKCIYVCLYIWVYVFICSALKSIYLIQFRYVLNFINVASILMHLIYIWSLYFKTSPKRIKLDATGNPSQDISETHQEGREMSDIMQFVMIAAFLVLMDLDLVIYSQLPARICVKITISTLPTRLEMTNVEPTHGLYSCRMTNKKYGQILQSWLILYIHIRTQAWSSMIVYIGIGIPIVKIKWSWDGFMFIVWTDSYIAKTDGVCTLKWSPFSNNM